MSFAQRLIATAAETLKTVEAGKEHEVASDIVDLLTKACGKYSKKEASVKMGSNPGDGTLIWKNPKYGEHQFKEIKLSLVSHNYLEISLQVVDKYGSRYESYIEPKGMATKNVLDILTIRLVGDSSWAFADVFRAMFGLRPFPKPKVTEQGLSKFAENLGDESRAVFRALPKGVQAKIERYRIYNSTRYKYAFQDFLSDPKSFGYTGKLDMH